MDRIPAVLCIDVEPDDREVDRSAPSWAGFEKLLSSIGRLRDELETSSGAPARA